jgi:hypothetical protein
MEIMKQKFLIITHFLVFLFICCFSTKVVATKTDIAQQFISILFFKKGDYFPENVRYKINNTYSYRDDINRRNDTYTSGLELSTFKTKMKKILE